jgi:hypothetical protein
VIPIGYLAKRSVTRPEGLGDRMPQIADIYSVSSHVNDDFVDYIEFWKHNGYGLFDSPGLIREIVGYQGREQGQQKNDARAPLGYTIACGGMSTNLTSVRAIVKKIIN